MRINLHYNEFMKDYELDIFLKIGFIQEKILNLNNLLIYNIEYSHIKIKNNFYILGSDDLSFHSILKDFLDKYNLNENDIEEIITYDRKRDENGNVIKENIIINKYNEWFINNENDNYLNYIENNNNRFNNFDNNNAHIIRFPIDVILENILRMPFNNIQNNNSQDNMIHNIDNMVHNINDMVHNIDDIDNMLQDDINDNQENDIDDNQENDIDDHQQDDINDNQQDDINDINDNQQDEENNINENDVRRSLRSGYIQNLNEIINIFDNIIQRNIPLNNRFPINNEYVSLPIFPNLSHEFDDLPDLIDDNNNIFNFMNMNQSYEDIKVVLTEEQFNNQKHSFFKELKCYDLKECLICIQEFENEDEVTKITCNHIFHKNCIKNWVCHESNKCPICRLEVDKGNAK